jgi:hypothetical protein
VTARANSRTHGGPLKVVKGRRAMWRSVEFREKPEYTADDQLLDFINQHQLKPEKYKVVRSDYNSEAGRFQRYELSYWEEEKTRQPSDVA